MCPQLLDDARELLLPFLLQPVILIALCVVCIQPAALLVESVFVTRLLCLIRLLHWCVFTDALLHRSQPIPNAFRSGFHPGIHTGEYNSNHHKYHKGCNNTACACDQILPLQEQ